MSADSANFAKQMVVCSNCQTKNRVPSVARGVPRCGKCHRPLPWVVNATDTDFASVPCRMVSPALEQLAGELAGQLKLVKVNADESPAVSGRFEVQAIPTLVLLNRGKVIDKQVGAAPIAYLRTWVTSKLDSKA